MTEAYICDYIRTPIGRYGGALSSIRADDLAAIPIKALIDRNAAVDWAGLDETVAGLGEPAGVVQLLDRHNRECAAVARRLALQSGDTAAIVVASWAQAAAAHARGELHQSVWADLQETTHVPHLAVRVFDGHLCITQRFLYGAKPYAEVIAFAEAIATEAKRLGAARLT